MTLDDKLRWIHDAFIEATEEKHGPLSVSVEYGAGEFRDEGGREYAFTCCIFEEGEEDVLEGRPFGTIDEAVEDTIDRLKTLLEQQVDPKRKLLDLVRT